MADGPPFNSGLPPCPECGGTLRLEMRLRVVPGVFAGTTPKVAAQDWPHLMCDCGFAEAGKVDRG